VKRSAKLRVLALDAYRAALETKDLAASAAATADTHPLVDVQQSKHILGNIKNSESLRRSENL